MAPQPPAIDPTTLAELAADTGPAVIPDLIKVFLETAHARIGRMAAAVAEGNGPAVAAEAHALKSSAATFGAAEVRNLCAELERTCKGGLAGNASGNLSRLEKALAAAERELADYLEAR